MPKTNRIITAIILTILLSLGLTRPVAAQQITTGQHIAQAGPVQPQAIAAQGNGLNDVDPTAPLSEDVLNEINPLFSQNTEGEKPFTAGNITPASIIQRILLFAFPLAGLILFIMLIWSGAEIIAGASDKKSLDAGKNRATAAILGFLLLFVSYWIVQIIEIVFNISIISR